MTPLEEYFQTTSGVDNSPFGIAFHILVLAVATFGSFANFAVLISTSARKDLNPHFSIILSLCFADFCLSTTVVITLSLHLAYQSWELPGISAATGCVINTFFNTLFLHTSGLSFVLLAIERYVVIIKSWYRHLNWVLGWIAAQWTYSIIVASTLVSSQDNVKNASSLLVCQPNLSDPSPTIYVLGSCFVTIVIIGLSAICYCYYSIYQFYKNRKTAGGRQKATAAKETKLMIRLLIISGIYVIMYAPWLAAMVYDMVTWLRTPYWLACLYLISIVFNCSINPVLLYKLDPSIKNQFNYFYSLETMSLTKSSSDVQSALSKAAVSLPLEEGQTRKITINESNDGNEGGNSKSFFQERATFKISRTKDEQ